MKRVSSIGSMLPTIPKRILKVAEMRRIDPGEVESFPDMIQRLTLIDPMRPVVYPAGPLGFAASTRDFHEAYMQRMIKIGIPETNILDPWKLTHEKEFVAVAKMNDYRERMKARAALHKRIGKRNRIAEQFCDFVTANLDGPAVDDGTAAEIGFASGVGMPIFGIRTDMRLGGDGLGERVNLQIEEFIDFSGGNVQIDLEKHFAVIGDFVHTLQEQIDNAR